MDLSIEVVVAAGLLSLLGGLGSYLQGVREGRFPHNVLNAVTEIVLALSAGLLVMYLGQWQHWPQPLTSVLILLGSNNGGDTFVFLKRTVSQYVTNRFNSDGNKSNG